MSQWNLGLVEMNPVGGHFAHPRHPATCNHCCIIPFPLQHSTSASRFHLYFNIPHKLQHSNPTSSVSDPNAHGSAFNSAPVRLQNQNADPEPDSAKAEIYWNSLLAIFLYFRQNILISCMKFCSNVAKCCYPRRSLIICPHQNIT